jgi:hypothetical protein
VKDNIIIQGMWIGIGDLSTDEIAMLRERLRTYLLSEEFAGGVHIEKAISVAGYTIGVTDEHLRRAKFLPPAAMDGWVEMKKRPVKLN